MRSADRHLSRALRATLLATACALAGTAYAGGPLWIVPSGGTLKPAHWEGTVKVYLDKGNLIVGTNCVVDENWNCMLDGNGNPVYPVLDEKSGDDLVSATIAQWSNVPTSSFRAEIAGRSPVDINGSNVWNYIGKYNGGGIQTIYDADNTVIDALTGGAGWGVLGIASPEYLAAEGSTEIVEGWQVIGGSPLSVTDTGPISGIVTHEFGHAIGLAHTQTNGYYSRNQGNPDWGTPDGTEQAGPDQCGKIAGFPTPDQIETMYPMIDPYESSRTYNSPEMATVNVADDIAALSSLYPAANYAETTGTLKGRVVAKDGKTPVTGVNVIARPVSGGDLFAGAISRISGDLTQGILGPDGNFVMTGLVPGVSYVVYIDQIADGGFSTPKAVLMGPEEYWDSNESADATKDDACASTPVTLGAGQTMQIQIAMNGIDRAPTFVQIPYGYAIMGVSDNGQKVLGGFGGQGSPYWLWDKQTGSTVIGGAGSSGGLSGNGRVVGGTVGVQVDTEYGPVTQEHAALWTKEAGWKSIAPDLAGCGDSHTHPYDLSADGSVVVGLAAVDCSNWYAFRWTARTGMQLLPKSSENRVCDFGWGPYECEGSSRANAVSGNGSLIGGWEEVPEAFGFRVGSIWQGNEQMLLRDPAGDNAVGGWVGEVMGVNSSGSIAVGINAGPQLKDAYEWTATAGVTSLGHLPGQVCYFDWWSWEEVCEDLETVAYSVSDDGKVITGSSRLLTAGIDNAAIYTPKMGWMLLADFLQSQGVLEAQRWLINGAVISADGKTIAGRGYPMAADYVHGFRLDLDQVYVCHGQGKAAQTLRVGFPDAMDVHLAHGDTVGLCPGDAPL
jgi:hypothetical protein